MASSRSRRCRLLASGSAKISRSNSAGAFVAVI
jgi:hypothetical protein